MKLKISRICSLCAALVILLSRSVECHGREATIFVDPNVRISYDGDDAIHQEAPIAASATTADQLYAASTVNFPHRGLLEAETRLYTSQDAGATWNAIALQEGSAGSWDSSIAAGKEGTAYFVTSTTKPRVLTVFRTHDHGITWKSAVIKDRSLADRPFSVVDTTSGVYSGRLYIIGTSYPRGLIVYNSSDGGVSFSEKVTACPGGDQTSATPVVLSDGTLVVPCRFHQRLSSSDPRSISACDKEYPDTAVSEIGVVISRDGGRTFSPYRLIARVKVDCGYVANEQIRNGALIGPVAIHALAASKGNGVGSERLYAAWASLEHVGTFKYRALSISHSSDHGVTWSKPKPVGGSLIRNRERVDQVYPMLAVTNDGIVGIAWYDNRNVSGGHGYDIYFSSSLDGGQNFLPEVRVSEITSDPARPENINPAYDRGRSGKNYALFSNSYVVRTLGADFAQMTVDTAGRFHPLWLDTRDGGWQLYTSAIRVLRGSVAVYYTHLFRINV